MTIALLRILFHLADSLLGAPPGAVAVASLRKEWLKQRLQLLGDCLLDHPVYDRGDAKLPHSASVWFGNFLAPDRAWLVPSLPDALQKLVSMFLQPWQRLFYGHSVDSWRSMIAFDLLVGSVQIVSVQNLLQQVRCTASFFTFPNSGTPRSRILFVFHTFPLRAALSVFRFHRADPPSCVYSRLTIVRPFPRKKKTSRYYGLC
ncbi:hypothetical protein D3C81_1303130 [compost metagenome]